MNYGTGYGTKRNKTELIVVVDKPTDEVWQKCFVLDIQREYSDILANGMEDLTTTDVCVDEIHLLNDKPIKQPMRKVPFMLRTKYWEGLQALKNNKIIEESNSPYSFGVVLAEKPNGDVRICIDLEI